MTMMKTMIFMGMVIRKEIVATSISITKGMAMVIMKSAVMRMMVMMITATLMMMVTMTMLNMMKAMMF